jgi:Fe-S cluster biogenesis protein NfuA/nitrite reductase/ring-hydroxylating ferredoxin subunit
MTDRPEELQRDAQWRSAGDRIQTLLDAASAGGAVARERAEQLVREVVELYGACLSRVLAAVNEKADPGILDRMAADDLVASLLLVHGLHPHDVRRRVSDALDRVRPYLGSHGGDVHLLDIVGDTVQLQFAGSCKSCPSSAVTLELAVEDAIRAAAPEVSSIEVVAPKEEAAGTAAVIPAESLLAQVHSRAHSNGPAVWHQVPDLADLADAEVGGFVVAGVAMLACRVGDQLYAYRDHCPACEGSVAGAVLHRLATAARPVLRCPRCHAHFDVVHAGAGLDDGTDHHLDPIPLLVRDGVLSIAVRPATIQSAQRDEEEPGPPIPAEPMGAAL